MNLVSKLPENLIFFQDSFYYFISYVVLVLIVFFCGVIVSVLIKELRVSHLPEESVKEDAYKEALRILDDARIKSLKILSMSQEKAAKTLEDSGNLSKITKEEVKSKLYELYRQQEKVLSSASGEMLVSFKQAVESEKTESIKSLSDAVSQVKVEIEDEIVAFRDVLRKQTFETQKQIDAKLQASYQQVEQEIGEYKSEKISQIHDKLSEVLANISMQVLGVTITTEDHEKFIFDTLKDELRKAGLVRVKEPELPGRK